MKSYNNRKDRKLNACYISYIPITHISISGIYVAEDVEIEVPWEIKIKLWEENVNEAIQVIVCQQYPIKYIASNNELSRSFYVIEETKADSVYCCFGSH